MTFLKCAAVSAALVLAAGVVSANEMDATAHDLAAKCAAKNGTFDADANACNLPNEDSAASDLVIGPMMTVIGTETHEASDSQ